MGLLDLLLGRKGAAPLPGGELLARVRTRSVVPEHEAERERYLAQQYAIAQHAAARVPPPLGRRVVALVDAARRGRSDELAEALHGLELADAPAVLDALAERRDRPGETLAAVARELAGSTASLPVLGLSLALLALSRDPEDARLLVEAGRSEALAGPAAEALRRRGDAASLLALARTAEGIGRALALEHLALLEHARADAALVDEALLLAGAIDDVVTRAYAAVTLLEVSGVAARVPAATEELLDAVASGLEACARGGWNGGPGPGLGRLPGAQAAADAILAREDADAETRRRSAVAVLTASPIVAGPLRRKAEELLRQMAR